MAPTGIPCKFVCAIVADLPGTPDGLSTMWTLGRNLELFSR